MIDYIKLIHVYLDKETFSNLWITNTRYGIQKRNINYKIKNNFLLEVKKYFSALKF